MLSPKMDLSTIHGRIQYARDRGGYQQEEFSKLVNYSPSGWQKVEQGVRNITADTIEKVNEILNLDVRYYFGQIPYDDAVGGVNNNYAALVAKIQNMENNLAPAQALDEVTRAYLKNDSIKECVTKMSLLSENLQERILGMIEGYLSRVNEEDREREAKTG